MGISALILTLTLNGWFTTIVALDASDQAAAARKAAEESLAKTKAQCFASCEVKPNYGCSGCAVVCKAEQQARCSNSTASFDMQQCNKEAKCWCTPQSKP
jgi:hypothetical protein